MWNGSNWIQRGQDIDGEASGDNSGRSVSLNSDGSIIAIGAPFNDGNGSNSGHVRVYTWNGTIWTKMGQDIDGEASNDNSGRSVSLSSNGYILAIGALNNDGVSKVDGGSVRVYSWDGSVWTKMGSDIDGEASNDNSGTSICLSSDGSVIAIGSPNNDGVSKVDCGSVRIYSWNGTNWIKRGQDIDGNVSYDYCGFSVSLNSNGTIIAMGSYRGNYSQGYTKIYSWNGTNWIKMGNDIVGTDTNYPDNSGVSVSLNSSGNLIAIGSYLNSDNGLYSGCVRVYQWYDSNWTQKGTDINGIAGDNSGISVSINSDGSIVAIGASMNDGNTGNKNDNRGCTRVYKYVVAPDPPTIISTIGGNGQIIINYSVPTNNGGSTITHYTAMIYNNLNNLVKSTEILSSDPPANITIIGLTNGMVYTVKMKAKNIVGYSIESSASTPITPTNPICYIGESKVLVKNKETNITSEICVKDINLDKHLVYSVTQNKFVKIIVNCISGETSDFILIKKNLFGENKPSEDFYITENHPIMFNNCEIMSQNIIGAEKIKLEKQLIYSLVTENREALLINNIEVICWKYSNFLKTYNKKKKAIWINKTGEIYEMIKK